VVTLDDLDLFPAPAGPRPGAPTRKFCRHPRDARRTTDDGQPVCTRCGKDLDPTMARRGRNNRARGNAIERAVAHDLGLRRVGQYGGPEDIAGLAFVGQVKSGKSFPERLWSWLHQVPVAADQTRILIVTDAPGPGHPRRALVVLELADWKALHGETL
jgi:hypothetical protein